MAFTAGDSGHVGEHNRLLTIGTLGYAQVTSTESGFAAGPTNISGLSKTVTVGSGRRIRVTVKTRGSVTVGTDAFKLQIRESTTELSYFEHYFPTSAVGGTMMATVILTPSTGSHTYVGSITRLLGAGGFNSNATATDPAWILVEDIGV